MVVEVTAITFDYNLNNSLQTFRVISNFELHLDEENGDSAKFVEGVLDPTLHTNTTFDDSLWVVPQHESKLFNEVVENPSVVVNFRGCKKIRSFALKRRTSIWPLLSDAQEGHRTALTWHLCPSQLTRKDRWEYESGGSQRSQCLATDSKVEVRRGAKWRPLKASNVLKYN